VSETIEVDPLENPHRAPLDERSLPVAWSRVGMVELNHHWPWLVERLKGRYPLAAERELRSHLMGMLADNDAYFVCNEAAIALFVVIRRPLQYPRVEEQFCIAMSPEHADFAEALYGPVGVWVRRLGIRDLDYLLFSDATAFVACREAGALERKTKSIKTMIMEDHRGG
jgi:hypothetical protein